MASGDRRRSTRTVIRGAGSRKTGTGTNRRCAQGVGHVGAIGGRLQLEVQQPLLPDESLHGCPGPRRARHRRRGHQRTVRNIADRPKPGDPPYQDLAAGDDGAVAGQADTNGSPACHGLHLRPHAGLLVSAPSLLLHKTGPTLDRPAYGRHERPALSPPRWPRHQPSRRHPSTQPLPDVARLVSVRVAIVQRPATAEKTVLDGGQLKCPRRRPCNEGRGHCP